MGLYKRLVKEASTEAKAPGYRKEVPNYGRAWSLPAPGAGGYVTEEDLEWEYGRLQREWRRVQEAEEKRAKEIRVLRAFARPM